MTGSKERTNLPVCRHDCLKIGGVRATRIILWLAAITIVSFIIGFGILALSGGFPPSKDQSFSPFRHTAFLSPNTTTIPLDGATAGDVKLTLGAGELNVRGGAPDGALMEADIFSKSAVWQPELLQSINNSRKNITMTEKGHKGKELFAVDSPNSWEIRLNDTVPLRLDVNVGAGDSRLILGTLSLESLTVQTGAGDTTIDLEGYHSGRYDAAIKHGVGDLTLRVPRDSNTRIQVHNGIGDTTGNGFVREGGSFVTPSFNPALPVNEISLNQGIGSISLEAI